MNPEQQRIAIAKACGWEVDEERKTYGFQPLTDGCRTYTELPDFLHDLNAMHDAEKMLTHDQMIDYSQQVGKLVTSHLPASRAAWMDFSLMNTTASQRAEAFLRTIGKWEESK